MRQIFIDTSAYFALADEEDKNHQAASGKLQQLIRERASFTTTNIVIAETHTLTLKRIGYKTALEVIERIYSSQIRIYRIREADEKKALDIIRKYTDKDFPFVDALSFAVMEKLHITQAFTFDKHFTQYGFTLL